VWEELFSAEFHDFDQSALREGAWQRTRRLTRATQYSVPLELQTHVSYVFNLGDFPASRSPKVSYGTPEQNAQRQRDVAAKKKQEQEQEQEREQEQDERQKKTASTSSYSVTVPKLNAYYDVRSNTASR